MSRYLTTTLPYLNGDPHLGHALEFVQADFLARALRAQGEEVYLNIGTDEHGAKVAEKAKEAGEEIHAYVDRYAKRFKDFADRLEISYDSFIRTTDPAHMKAAQEFWKRCLVAGDIYQAKYEVRYCVGCELEKTDSELVGGRCPLHPNLEIEIRTEKNYYFKFSRYQQTLMELFAKEPEFVVPKKRFHEIVTFVKNGLKDFSISRPKEKLAWGVPVPDDDTQVMYVWFDALVNYVSAVGWPSDEEKFKKWWPVVQLAGKDQVRQQAGIWQGMLASAGLPFSKQIFIHGFINISGEKMSKSIGNVIDPLKIAEQYGVDVLRYFLLRHVNPTEDTDIGEATIHEAYTTHLTNGLGNLVARVMTLAEQNLPHAIELTDEDERVDEAFYEKVEAYRFNEAMDLIFEQIGAADVYMNERAPYKKIKSGDAVEREAARRDIEQLVHVLAKIAAHLIPAMPRTAAAIAAAVRKNQKPKNLFPRIDKHAGEL
ncbi:methionine--tRNA ligase [Candidatus Kaiserbacteria bacterium]|nr:methionine--tRNA ligase [Candidatus Kaiserbacteria bacterium]